MEVFFLHRILLFLLNLKMMLMLNKKAMQTKGFFCIDYAILNDIVWDYHRTPRGTTSLFLYLVSCFITSRDTVCINMNQLKLLYNKTVSNKDFKRGFKWLVNNGYFNIQNDKEPNVYKLSLTDKTNNLVKFYD